MKGPALCLLAFVVAGCATSGAANNDLDPLGIYDFTTVVQGEQITGSFRIERTEGEYRGSLMASGLPAMSILRVTVDGQWLTIQSNTGTNPLELELAFVGDTFTGEWKIHTVDGTVEDSGTIAGRRRTGTGGDSGSSPPIPA
jgi:hypothetical protein